MLPALPAVLEVSRLQEGPLLAEGESVQATVLATREDGRLVVLVKGTPLTAVSEVGPLPVGQVLQARVESLGDRLRLRLEPPLAGSPAGAALSTDRLAALLKLLLPADQSVVDSLGRLLAGLRSAAATPAEAPGAARASHLAAELTALVSQLALPPGPLSAERVRDALLALGLQYEHGLARQVLHTGRLVQDPGEPTLKAWVLAVLARFAGREPAEPSSWGLALARLAQALDRLQALNALNAQTGLPLVIELPLSWGGASPVWLAVERRESEGGAGGDQARRLSVMMALELDGLGAVRIHATLTGWRIGVRVLVEGAEVERAVIALLPVLGKGLAAQGFDVEALTAGTADRETLRGEDLRAKLIPELGLVTVRA
ncbi:flagellar hook-length control protein FliK [Nitrospira sp. Kam-Ns4a]